MKGIRLNNGQYLVDRELNCAQAKIGCCVKHRMEGENCSVVYPLQFYQHFGGDFELWDWGDMHSVDV